MSRGAVWSSRHLGNRLADRDDSKLPGHGSIAAKSLGAKKFENGHREPYFFCGKKSLAPFKNGGSTYLFWRLPQSNLFLIISSQYVYE